MAATGKTKIQIRDQRSKRWFAVSTDLVDRYMAKLSVEAFALYVVLIRMSDQSSDPVSFPALGLKLNLATGRIMQLAAELSKAGLIEIGQEDGELWWTLDVPEAEEVGHA